MSVVRRYLRQRRAAANLAAYNRLVRDHLLAMNRLPWGVVHSLERDARGMLHLVAHGKGYDGAPLCDPVRHRPSRLNWSNRLL